jgi:hypothetical protein
MAEALENDLPDDLAEFVCCLVILPDGPPELLVREGWPDVGTAESSLIRRGVLSTYVIGLEGL